MADEMMIAAQEVFSEAVMVHQVILDLVEAPPAEISPGIFITIKVRATCPERCNFKGDTIQIIDHKGQVVKEAALIIPMGSAFATDPLVIKAPALPGTYVWKAHYPEQEKEGIAHLERSLPIPFIVKPLHVTSMAVWDVTSPAVVNDHIKFKVGVKCSADCRLAEREIEIFNQENLKIASAKLGDKPLPDTEALYWTEVEVPAPSQEGFYTWQVNFPEPNMAAQHLETTGTFGFRVMNPPECTVNVEVLADKDRTPIQGASIILQPYRSQTDEWGKARLEVTKGDYQLYVTGLSAYASYQKQISVSEDLLIEVELQASPFSHD
ncbi:hypothetical protein [Desulfitobacterium chlororespirans]|uniref:Uncharacterized protein n=1 Tax=Desulfitobacterium chlororespirans DSM 11544 TaxID=1121395 RepID=A0A1M7UJX9_9FIRM|nr:hypothetical protein [Desulfitobacterium chlororespirans]SHN83187.1 hypothetical protein SAMN02745215_03973 [Desulfitobacterium chlororespirans DSM 11544]